MNVTVLQGNLTRDPEVKTYGRGKNKGEMTVFGVAVNGYDDEVLFMDCVAFGKRGEAIEKYFSKGDKICVTGELKQSDYKTKSGDNATSISLTVTQFDFCEKKEK